jgi:hypothetical protein
MARFCTTFFYLKTAKYRLDPGPEPKLEPEQIVSVAATLLRTIFFHSNLVNVVVEEAAAGVEVDILELSLADELVGNLALEVHEQLQHVIVRLTGEHDFS